MADQALWGAGNDWVVALLTVVVPIGIWLFNQFAAQLNKPRPPAGPRPGLPPAGVPNPADEVQEFLQRVRQRRQEAESIEIFRPGSTEPSPPPMQQPQQRRGQRDRGEKKNSNESRSQRKQQQKPRQQPQQVARKATPAPPQPRRSVASSLSEQVARDIDTTDVTGRSALLTKLDQADEQLEAHLQSAFSHKLGSLESTATTNERVPSRQEAAALLAPTLAAKLLAQLASPDGVRQAVLMREILDRPTHRW